MSEITINKGSRRAIIRTSHTWYSVGLEWLIANAKMNPLFERAARMLGWQG